MLALKEQVCPLHIKERVSQRASGGHGDGSTGTASQHGFSGSYNTTNRSYFYRRLPLTKHMLLAFALKETCQTLSLPFNCLIYNRKDFLRNQQARTATWKPRVPWEVHWEVGPKASQRQEVGEGSFRAQVHRKVCYLPFSDKGFWAFSERKRL